MQKYSVAQFIKEFGSERACVEYIARTRWPEGIPCPNCEDRTEHYLIESRKCYECKECGTQTYPTKKLFGEVRAEATERPSASDGSYLTRRPDPCAHDATAPT